MPADKYKAAMLKQRLVASWRLLGKRPFGHPKFASGRRKNSMDLSADCRETYIEKLGCLNFGQNGQGLRTLANSRAKF